MRARERGGGAGLRARGQEVRASWQMPAMSLTWQNAASLPSREAGAVNGHTEPPRRPGRTAGAGPIPGPSLGLRAQPLRAQQLLPARRGPGEACAGVPAGRSWRWNAGAPPAQALGRRDVRMAETRKSSF